MKAIVRIGYDEYVMDIDKAITLLDSLAGAERYERVYHGDSKKHTHHVWDENPDECIREMKIIPENILRVARLAGKPVRK